MSSPQPAPINTGTLVDQRSSTAGLRAVAGFEAAKGLVVIALMFLIFGIHQHAPSVVESFFFHLHVDLDRNLPHRIMLAANQLSDMRLWTIAAAALSYAAVRFIEAWGLWNRRVWAEWFALLSGAMYVPIEILRLVQHPNRIHVAVLAVNVLIVVYMLYVRLAAVRQDRLAKRGWRADAL